MGPLISCVPLFWWPLCNPPPLTGPVYVMNRISMECSVQAVPDCAVLGTVYRNSDRIVGTGFQGNVVYYLAEVKSELQSQHSDQRTRNQGEILS